MRKNLVQHVVLHGAQGTASPSAAKKISLFHVQIIERRLVQSGLSAAHKAAVIDRVLAIMRAEKPGG